MPTQLSVNLNKVATLRNTRTVGVPSITRAARLCLDAGAHGITLHPRPDQRHIRPADVRAITELLSEYPRVELNLEGNPFHGLVEHVEASRPAQATLVPDDSAQATSDHGWDLRADGERLRPVIHQLKSLGCRVSLFMDPVPENMSLARGLGADRIELYTESYARQFALGSAAAVTAQFRDSALAAQRAGLGVNAGHDLSLDNLGAFLKDVPGVLEVSIGHALVADALEYGLAGAVSRYLARCVTP